MASNPATILIPDISGFTEFITKTELDHGAHAINFLLDAILAAVGDEYEVAEIEGDAVLLYRNEANPSKKDILGTCLKIFNAFHVQRKWMQQHAVCPCGACQAIIDLTLKFVVHHGLLSELKVGRFIKPSGPDMIVAHRLLKNSIGSNEYVLLTDKVWARCTDHHEGPEMNWETSSDEFGFIGKVDYKYALLEATRKQIPDPPVPEGYTPVDTPFYYETIIAAHFRDVYMVVMNIPGRSAWVPGLDSVEQEIPEVFIGSVHRCTFGSCKATISPLSLNLSEDGIVYSEKRQLEGTDIALIYEHVFRKMDDNRCYFIIRIMPADNYEIPLSISEGLHNDLKSFSEQLSNYCEGMEESFFAPLVVQQ